jgi:hypothetical protein
MVKDLIATCKYFWQVHDDIKGFLKVMLPLMVLAHLSGNLLWVFWYRWR